jgi:hypothetical protein
MTEGFTVMEVLLLAVDVGGGLFLCARSLQSAESKTVAEIVA